MSIFLIAVLVLFSSCATTKHNVLMGDVITFSENAKTSWKTDGNKQTDPIVIHSETKKYDSSAALKLKQEIHDAKYGTNTSLIYALDLGLDRIKYVRKHQLKGDKQAKYYIFLLTDGLDNTSVDMARITKRGNYKNTEAYEKKLRKKIKTVMGSGKEQNFFQIWPMLQIGDDMDKFRESLGMDTVEFVEFCKDDIMSKYTGASKGWESIEPIVSYKFQVIKDKVADQFSNASFDFYVPKGYAGKKIKMKMRSVDGKTASFVGKLVKKGRRYYLLCEIEEDSRLKLSQGTSSNPKKGLVLTATNNSEKDAIVAWFHIENMKYNNKRFTVDTEQVEQSFKTEINGTEIFQINSEYDKDAKPAMDTYFVLIMDASLSIGDKVKEEQGVMNKVIDVITATLREKK